MTLGNMMEELHDNLGAPDNELDPYDSGGSLDNTSTGWTRLLRWLNQAYIAVAGWKFRDGSFALHPSMMKRMFVQGATKTGTAEAGADQTITLESGAVDANDDQYNGWVIELTGGTGSGQTRMIMDYVGSTRVTTVHKEWDTNPDATSTYKLYKNFWMILDSSHAWAADHIGVNPVSVFIAPQKLFDLKHNEEVIISNPRHQYPDDVLNAAEPTLWYWDENKIYLDVPVDDDRYFELEYIAYPDQLSAESDVPEIPERYHEAIVLYATWLGLLRQQESDEAYAMKRNVEDFMSRIMNPREAFLSDKIEGRWIVGGHY